MTLSPLTRRQKNFLLLLLPLLCANVALRYLTLNEDCFRGLAVTAHYGFMAGGNISFLSLVVRAFLRKSANGSLLTHSLLCSIFFALVALHSTLAVQSGWVSPDCISP